MENEEGKKMNGPNATAGGADAGQYEDYQVPYDENEPMLFLPHEMGKDERKAFGKFFAGRMKDDAPLALQLRREEPCGMVYNPQRFKGLYTRNEIPSKELSAFVKMLQYHVVEECFELERLENELFDDGEKLPSLKDRGWWLATNTEVFFEAIRRMPKAECEGGVYFLDLFDFATRYNDCPACIFCNGCVMPNAGRLMLDGGMDGGILDVISRVLENFDELLGGYKRDTNPYWKDIITSIEDLKIDIDEDLRGELVTSNTLDWDRIEEIHDTIKKHVREFRKACAVEQAEEERLERLAKGGVVLETPEEPPQAQAVEAPANDDATKAKGPRKKASKPISDECGLELLETVLAYSMEHPEMKTRDVFKYVCSDKFFTKGKYNPVWYRARVVWGKGKGLCMDNLLDQDEVKGWQREGMQKPIPKENLRLFSQYLSQYKKYKEGM